MKLVLFVLFFYLSNALVHDSQTSILSKTYDNLPWPLLNPHSLDFLTTHGLHCYFTNQKVLQKESTNFVDKLHSVHCLNELRGVKDFLINHPTFTVDDVLCPLITGNGKKWIHNLGNHIVNYYNGSVYRITLNEYLSKEIEFQHVYSQNGNLDARLYIEYAHDSGVRNFTSPIIKSFNQQYISSQDTELRMIAGFNYGLILMKHLTNLDLSEAEAQYIEEQKKTEEEWSWATASFLCTFGSNTISVISKMEQGLKSKGLLN